MAKYPKKPKRPKASASLKTWENYDSRMKAWAKKCKEIDAAKNKKETIRKKYQ